jgi:hypothetical protein
MDMIAKKRAEGMKNPAIYKPTAWAVYQTWKWVNELEKTRGIENGNDD